MAVLTNWIVRLDLQASCQSCMLVTSTLSSPDSDRSVEEKVESHQKTTHFSNLDNIWFVLQKFECYSSDQEAFVRHHPLMKKNFKVCEKKIIFFDLFLFSLFSKAFFILLFWVSCLCVGCQGKNMKVIKEMSSGLPHFIQLFTNFYLGGGIKVLLEKNNLQIFTWFALLVRNFNFLFEHQKSKGQQNFEK